MTNRRYKKKKPVKDDYQPPFPIEVLNESIDKLNFRMDNTKALLTGAGASTINDLVRREAKDFYRILTFNKKNLNDVMNALRVKGLFIKPSEPQQQQQQNAPNERRNRPERQQERQQDRQQQNRQRQPERQQGQQNREARKPEEEKRQRPKAEKPKVEPDIYVKINKNDKWGFSDRSGKVMVEPVYDEVFSYKDDLCCVEKDDKFGFVDRKGEEVIPIMYELAFSFSEGYACVYKNGKCGYIDKNNVAVVDFKYDAGTIVESGSCRIKKDGKWGELVIADPSTVRWII